MASRIKQIDWFRHFFDGEPRIKNRFLLSRKTRYQQVIILQTYSYGKCLILDDELQSSEFDEKLYHQSLVHPVMHEINRNQLNVLILGGGEGATLREVCKHPSVQTITMVDLDREVVEIAMDYLPTWHQNSFSDKRVQLIFQDAMEFIQNSNDFYDLIIMDLPSPASDNAIKPVYSLKSLQSISLRLVPKGWIVTQAGPNHPFHPNPHQMIWNNFHPFFQSVKSHSIFIPSFNTPWTFIRGQK